MMTMLKMLVEERNKRLYSTYLVVVPHLMINVWWKQLGKDANLMVTIPIGILFLNMVADSLHKMGFSKA